MAHTEQLKTRWENYRMWMLISLRVAWKLQLGSRNLTEGSNRVICKSHVLSKVMVLQTLWPRGHPHGNPHGQSALASPCGRKEGKDGGHQGTPPCRGSLGHFGELCLRQNGLQSSQLPLVVLLLRFKQPQRLHRSRLDMRWLGWLWQRRWRKELWRDCNHPSNHLR